MPAKSLAVVGSTLLADKQGLVETGPQLADPPKPEAIAYVARQLRATAVVKIAMGAEFPMCVGQEAEWNWIRRVTGFFFTASMYPWPREDGPFHTKCWDCDPATKNKMPIVGRLLWRGGGQSATNKVLRTMRLMELGGGCAVKLSAGSDGTRGKRTTSARLLTKNHNNFWGFQFQKPTAGSVERFTGCS